MSQKFWFLRLLFAAEVKALMLEFRFDQHLHFYEDIKAGRQMNPNFRLVRDLFSRCCQDMRLSVEDHDEAVKEFFYA